MPTHPPRLAGAPVVVSAAKASSTPTFRPRSSAKFRRRSRNGGAHLSYSRCSVFLPVAFDVRRCAALSRAASVHRGDDVCCPWFVPACAASVPASDVDGAACRLFPSGHLAPRVPHYLLALSQSPARCAGRPPQDVQRSQESRSVFQR